MSSEPADLSKARNVKALTGHAHAYRLRAGSYRVFFESDGAVRIVSIKDLQGAELKFPGLRCVAPQAFLKEIEP